MTAYGLDNWDLIPTRDKNVFFPSLTCLDQLRRWKVGCSPQGQHSA